MRKLSLLVLFVLTLGRAVSADEAGPIPVPEVLGARIDLTVEDVLNLNTSPLQFLPPVDGYFYAVEWSVCLHTGRFATSPGLLTLRVPGASQSYLRYTGFSCLVRPTVDGNAGAYDRQFGIGAIDDGPTAWGSKGIEVFVPGGNPTATEEFPGSAVTILLYYRLMPARQSLAPSIDPPEEGS